MTQVTVTDTSLEDVKQTARILYVLHGLCFFFSAGLLNLAVLVVNYLKRPDSQGTFVFSHHSWMIRSYWYYLLWMAVGWLLMVTLIGIPLAVVVFIAAWLWEAYRLVRGFVDLNNNREMP
ncbi:MAG TPA: hypothetical protein VFF16_14330 [Telluria sp.]|nr:hypothetical protein [Telluria sp.]